MPGIPPRQQYLVVAWDAISLLPWIQYYGSWDFPTATGTRSEVSRQMHPLSFDLGTGLLAVGGGQQVTVLSADLLASDVQHFEFPENEPGRRALVSLATGEVMVLDERAYRSTLVQLLIGTPDWIEAQTPFHLVIDRLPEARVFRVDAGDAR